MKEMIIKKLQEVAGLSEEQAKKAADVVMNIVESEAAGDIGKKLSGMAGGMAGGLGGMLGGDKDKD